MHNPVPFVSRLAIPLLCTLAVAPPVHGQEADADAEVARARDLLNAVLPQGLSRDVRTQYMMIDEVRMVVPGRDGATGDARADAPGNDARAGAPGDARTDAAPDGHPSRSGGPQGPGVFVASTAEGGRFILIDDRPARPGDGIDDQEAIVGFLQSLGESTGAAFQLQVGGETAFQLGTDGLVVEPVVIRDQLWESVQGEITRLAAQNPVTQVLNAYCLEFLKSPPSVDQIFRIAEDQLQQLYRPAANILRAGRQLVENGFLEDHPLDYIHSLKQWALWAAEGDFDFDSFSERFLAHAQDNFSLAGRDWNEQIQALVEGTLPERWGFIEQILSLAEQMPGGRQWRVGN